MSQRGWQSTVTVGGEEYTGDGRGDREKTVFAAARAALKALGLPYDWSGPGGRSNKQAMDDLERYCRENKLCPPSYGPPKPCRYTPQPGGGGRRRKPPQQFMYIAELNVGLDRSFFGKPATGMKNAAVEAAREALMHLKPGSSVPANSDIEELEHFFVSLKLSKEQPEFSFYSASDDVSLEVKNDISLLDDVQKKFRSREPDHELASPVDYRQHEITADDGTRLWVMECKVMGKTLKSRAFSKLQNAKNDVARKAYTWITEALKGTVSPRELSLEATRNGVDKIDRECKTMLAQVCHNLLEPAVQDDVHAAILMTTDHQSAKAKIITVASGTGFCKRSAAKSAVFDCHAEMLVRKGLIEFLFKQMETAGTPSSIFTRAAGKYSLKDAVRFHLFVSKIPCGDACIPVGSKNKGDLRYRNTDGEGNLLAPKGDTSKYKMCCSAKIALWNVVGVQGAHLSQFLTRPVYLSTILVKGLKTDAEEAQLKRAFYGRLQEMDLRHLPGGYRLNEPVIKGVVGEPDHESSKEALCWVNSREEIINTSDGTRMKGTLDISKQGIHTAYPSCHADQVKYREAKKLCQKKFRGNGWLHK